MRVLPTVSNPRANGDLSHSANSGSQFSEDVRASQCLEWVNTAWSVGRGAKEFVPGHSSTPRGFSPTLKRLPSLHHGLALGERGKLCLNARQAEVDKESSLYL